MVCSSLYSISFAGATTTSTMRSVVAAVVGDDGTPRSRGRSHPGHVVATLTLTLVFAAGLPGAAADATGVAAAPSGGGSRDGGRDAFSAFGPCRISSLRCAARFRDEGLPDDIAPRHRPPEEGFWDARQPSRTATIWVFSAKAASRRPPRTAGRSRSLARGDRGDVRTIVGAIVRMTVRTTVSWRASRQKAARVAERLGARHQSRLAEVRGARRQAEGGGGCETSGCGGAVGPRRQTRRRAAEGVEAGRAESQQELADATAATAEATAAAEKLPRPPANRTAIEGVHRLRRLRPGERG